MDYNQYANKSILVKIDTGDDEDKNPTFREVAGRCLAGNKTGLVLKTRNGQIEIIDGPLILEIEETTSKLSLRYLSNPHPQTIRQHLADRHGMELSDIPLYASDALELHSKINHDNLGHRHGEKPPTNRKRTGPTVEAVARRTEILESVNE